MDKQIDATQHNTNQHKKLFCHLVVRSLFSFFLLSFFSAMVNNFSGAEVVVCVYCLLRRLKLWLFLKQLFLLLVLVEFLYFEFFFFLLGFGACFVSGTRSCSGECAFICLSKYCILYIHQSIWLSPCVRLCDLKSIKRAPDKRSQCVCVRVFVERSKTKFECKRKRAYRTRCVLCTQQFISENV